MHTDTFRTACALAKAVGDTYRTREGNTFTTCEDGSVQQVEATPGHYDLVVGGLAPALVFDKSRALLGDSDPEVLKIAEAWLTEHLSDGGNFGLWYDPRTGEVCVDKVEVLTHTDREYITGIAVELGRARGEYSVYCFQTGEIIC